MYNWVYPGYSSTWLAEWLDGWLDGWIAVGRLGASNCVEEEEQY